MAEKTGDWVIVTGANRGLGKSLCGRFLAAGHNVWAVSRQGRCAEDWAGKAKPGGASIRDQRCDLANRTDIEELVKAASQTDISALICNAAMYSDTAFGGTTVDEVCRFCEVNAWSHLRIIKGLDGVLREGATIMFINTIGTTIGADKEFAYILSKKILSGIAEGLQHHFGKRGISVINVLLGGMKTDMARGRQGLDKFIDPEEAAAALVEMCSLRASLRLRTVEILRRKYQ